MPHLESERRYDICIPERDWAPGAAIMDCITTAVDSSRRMIVVLSRCDALSCSKRNPWDRSVFLAFCNVDQENHSPRSVPCSRNYSSQKKNFL